MLLLMMKGFSNIYPGTIEGGTLAGRQITPTLALKSMSQVGFLIPLELTWWGMTLQNRKPTLEEWKNAIKLCVMLCKKFGLSERDIICHSEGHKMGIASNHADVLHWFPKHGENMDTFRAAIKAELNKAGSETMRFTGNKG